MKTESFPPLLALVSFSLFPQREQNSCKRKERLVLSLQTEEEDKRLSHYWKMGGLCAAWEALEYGPRKSIFHLWLSDHCWALNSSYRLSAWPRRMSRLLSVCYTILPFPLSCSTRSLYVWLWTFSAATIGMSLCCWRCWKSSSSGVLRTLGLIAEAFKGSCMCYSSKFISASSNKTFTPRTCV